MQRIRRTFLALLAVAAVVGTVLAPLPVAAQSSGWQAGPGAVLDNTYDGFIDVPAASATVSTNGFNVAGWFVDRTAQGWSGADDVEVWLGTMDGGGRMLAKAQFAQSRPDVGTALGDPFWAASGSPGRPAHRLQLRRPHRPRLHRVAPSRVAPRQFWSSSRQRPRRS